MARIKASSNVNFLQQISELIAAQTALQAGYPVSDGNSTTQRFLVIIRYLPIAKYSIIKLARKQCHPAILALSRNC